MTTKQSTWKAYRLESIQTNSQSVVLVGLVTHLALIHLKPILMPLAIAPLISSLASEQHIYRRLEIARILWTGIHTFVTSMHFISIFLYDNLSQFIDKVPEISVAFEEKRRSIIESLWIRTIFSDADLLQDLHHPATSKHLCLLFSAHLVALQR